MAQSVDLNVVIEDNPISVTAPQGPSVLVSTSAGQPSTTAVIETEQVDFRSSETPAVDVSLLNPPFTVVTVEGPPGKTGPPGTNRPVSGEVPEGATDGANTVFRTAYGYQPGSVVVYRNGLRGTRDYDFIESGPQLITITTAPRPDDIIIIDYLVS